MLYFDERLFTHLSQYLISILSPKSNPLTPNCHLLILRCLARDNFTRQWEPVILAIAPTGILLSWL